MKTYFPKKNDIAAKWWSLDVTDRTLGRIATRIAGILRGKHKPEYTPHADMGDYVIVTNVEKLVISGRKDGQKVYHRHTQYPGGLRQMTFEKLQATHPERILELAVKGMLPRSPLGRAMLKKLKIYQGTEHPHTAQQPEPISD